MSDQTITSLIEKLEGAEVGSRELDGEIWYALHEPDVDYGALHIEQTEQGPIEVLTCELGSKYADCVDKYTTNLDAAMTLAERVFRGAVSSWATTKASPITRGGTEKVKFEPPKDGAA